MQDTEKHIKTKGKDPAFLFYSNDFLQGVSDMEMHEIGQYICMMATQHQRGSVSQRWLKKNIPDVSEYVLSKFDKDESGNYVNPKLLSVIEKRKKHSIKQSENGKKGGRPAKKKIADNNPKETQSITQKKPKRNPLENETEIVNEIEDVITDVIEILNAKAQKGFDSSTKSHRKHIRGRIREGANPEDFALVIEYKCAEWLGSPKRRAWLRPQTLFNSEKFQIYLDESRNNKAIGISADSIRRNDTTKSSRYADLYRETHGNS